MQVKLKNLNKVSNGFIKKKKIKNTEKPNKPKTNQKKPSTNIINNNIKQRIELNIIYFQSNILALIL